MSGVPSFRLAREQPSQPQYDPIITVLARNKRTEEHCISAQEVPAVAWPPPFSHASISRHSLAPVYSHGFPAPRGVGVSGAMVGAGVG